MSQPPIDFFGIGAPKCASTWLAQCLAEHPEVCMSEPKEPNFFAKRIRTFPEIDNPKYLADEDAYAACFAHRQEGQVTGEFSVQVMYNDRDAPKLIHDRYPDAKILVVLRDPVKRLYSHYWHRRNSANDPSLVPQSFEEAIQTESFLDWSRYAQQLRRWMKVYPKDRFWIGLDLDLKQGAQAFFADCCRHLGVDEDFVPPSLERRINKQTTKRGIVRRAWYAGQKMGPLMALGRNRFVKGVLERLDEKPAPYPPMDPALRAPLIERLRSDIEDLEKLLARDLSAWKQ